MKKKEIDIESLKRLDLLEESNIYDRESVDDFIKKANSTEKNLFIFASYQNLTDPFRQCVDILSSHFSVYIIYSRTVQTFEYSPLVKGTVSINRNFGLLAEILQKAKHDAVCITNLGMFWNWYFPFIKAHTKAKILVYGRDFMTVFHCRNMNHLTEIHNGNAELAEIETIADNMILDCADGIVTGFAGEGLEQIRKQNGNVHFCLTVLKPELNRMDENSQPLDLVFAGSMCSTSHKKMFNRESILYNIFGDILASGRCTIDAYTESNLYGDDLSEYGNLQGFRLNKGLPIEKLTDEIKHYGFGLCLQDYEGVDTDSLIAQKYIFPTKIFTYLAAGIPVIISREYEAAAKYLEAHELGFSIGREDCKNLAELIDKTNYCKFKNNIIQYQNSRLFDDEKSRLAEFIIRTV